FPDAAEEQIEMRILAAQADNSLIPSLVSGSLSATTALHLEYLSALRDKMFSGANLAGMKIVLDCANGAASTLAPDLFRGLGAEVLTIFDHSDGRNINDHCGSLHPSKMQEETVTSGA